MGLYTRQRADDFELSLGDTTEASLWGGVIVIAFDTKTAREKIRSKPVWSSAMNAKPRGQTRE